MKKNWQICNKILISLSLLLPSFILVFLLPTRILSYPQLKQNLPSTPNRRQPRSTIGAGGRLIEFPDSVSDPQKVPSPTNIDTSRGSGCGREYEIPWTALIPKDQVITTLTSQVTLFFYVPQPSSQKAEFLLVDKNGNDVYIQKLNLPEKAGLVSIQLPNTVYLELNQLYRWEFSLICTPEDRSQDEIILGSIKRFSLYKVPNESRLESKRKQQLLARLSQLKAEEAANSQILQNLAYQTRPSNQTHLDQVKQKQAEIILEQARIYAEFGLWNETLSKVGELKASIIDENDPLRDFKHQAWADLLTSVGLGNLANEKWMDCCDASNF